MLLTDTQKVSGGIAMGLPVLSSNFIFIFFWESMDQIKAFYTSSTNEYEQWGVPLGDRWLTDQLYYVVDLTDLATSATIFV